VHQRLTVPNLLTVARIGMAGIAGFLAVVARADAAAVAVLIAAALLDAFDGWYARTFSQCSALGTHLDPFADKLLMGVVYVWIGTDAGSPLVWTLIACSGAREVAITALRSHSLRRHGRFIPASRLGRAKMLAQSVAGLTILSVSHFLGRSVPTGIVAGAVLGPLAVSYAAGIAYLVEWRRARAADGHAGKGACRRPEADPLCATHIHG
jgi:phosphatidylglycerophosphate synthase